jgi:hypothetical protein
MAAGLAVPPVNHLDSACVAPEGTVLSGLRTATATSSGIRSQPARRVVVMRQKGGAGMLPTTAPSGRVDGPRRSRGHGVIVRAPPHDYAGYRVRA